MVQYNFKIESDLRDRVEQALVTSGLSGKSEFLEAMVTVYQTHLASQEESEIDMSRYQQTNDQTKEAIQKAFMHILSTLDYNFSTIKQELVYIDQEKEELTGRSEAIEAEIQKVKLNAHEEQKELTAKHEAERATLIEESRALTNERDQLKASLQRSQKELESMSAIAQQTQRIIEENKELRANQAKHNAELESIKEQYQAKIDALERANQELQKETRSKEQELFSVQYTLDRCQEEIKTTQKQLKAEQTKSDKQQQELKAIESKYNQLLGKVEVLERREREQHDLDD
jgi:chromosome segregation ATPase